MSNRLVIFAVAMSMMLLGGCATSRSTLDIQLPASTAVEANGKKVFINSVVDKRTFQLKPPSPEMPSLDPSEDQNDAVRRRAIGRKRNTYGMALGDILLKDGHTVESLTTSSIKQAFVESGYTIITNKDMIGADTYVVDADIEKFWAWMNPGFISITISAEIGTALSIKSSSNSSKQMIYVKAADGYQTASEDNWTEVIHRALELYIQDLKSKLK